MESEASHLPKDLEAEKGMNGMHEEVTIVHLKFVLNVVESLIF